ncbi:MAG: hypothetical protein RIC16_09235 [Rhodospirillales bacterium]
MSKGTRGKLVAFWLIMLLIPGLAVPVVLVELWYLYGYISLRGDYCGPFGLIDGEIGWTLKPNSRSCIMGKDAAFGDIAFRGEVTIDAEGARIPAPPAGSALPPPGRADVLVIGDSFPFGYGIDGADTFAARLETVHGHETALFASPAYSNAQAMMLGARAAELHDPSVIVYLVSGWHRAVCTGATRPTWILKPCYWTNPSGVAELVVPPAGFVERAAAWGMRPGGMVGAGEKTLGYFLISRPVSRLSGYLVRLGLMSGFADDFFGIASDAEHDAIRLASVRHALSLPARSGAHLIVLDPERIYAVHAEAFEARNDVTYVGPAPWQEAVGEPMRALPPDEARVPHDGHFGPGTHALIAAFVDRLIREIR